MHSWSAAGAHVGMCPAVAQSATAMARVAILESPCCRQCAPSTQRGRDQPRGNGVWSAVPRNSHSGAEAWLLVWLDFSGTLLERLRIPRAIEFGARGSRKIRPRAPDQISSTRSATGMGSASADNSTTNDQVVSGRGSWTGSSHTRVVRSASHALSGCACVGVHVCLGSRSTRSDDSARTE